MDRRENRWVIDKSINIGNLIAITILVWTVLTAYFNIKGRLDNVEFKVNQMYQLFHLSDK